MSVALKCKSGEAGEDSVNLMASDGRSKYGWRSQVWWIEAAAVCVGLLLLILILGVVAHTSGAISHWDVKCENLIYSLTVDRDNLRNELDQLKIKSNNMTKDMEVLQSQYNAMAANRDKLQEEVTMLNQTLRSKESNKTGQTCHQGWKTFGGKCYFFSPSGVTKTWEASRKDCKERGADLVIITTKEELDFVSKTYAVTWIGLSDKEQENTWKWVDGTDLVGKFWQVGEPNNSDGNEDCAEVSRSAKKFNDVPCDRRFSWACEI
ncbi:C-type lectin domain family 4 member E-like [Plectropomus leopardus]|uniref:C-type lectin domain family 4 member E-like n=1 Tax=Plectropomus leopardus TaxID=160734 RepID=UPI001C4A7AF9|nr:C-type lectin domain family 4 member E-like [Plectropomus leopardus]